MQTTYFGDNNQYATLTADEGYWLTTWNEVDDISTFNNFKTVRVLSELAGLFHEITEEQAMAYAVRRERLMFETVQSISDESQIE